MNDLNKTNPKFTVKDKKFPTSVSVQHVEQVYSHWPFHIALV